MKHFACPVLRPKAVISVSDISLLISMVALGSLMALFTAFIAATFSVQAAYQTWADDPQGSGVVTVTTQPDALSAMRNICRVPIEDRDGSDSTEGVRGISFQTF